MTQGETDVGFLIHRRIQWEKTNSLQGAAYFLDTKPAPAAWWSMESTMIALSDSKVIAGSKPASLKKPICKDADIVSWALEYKRSVFQISKPDFI